MDTNPGVLHPGRAQSLSPAMLGDYAQLPCDGVVFSAQEKRNKSGIQLTGLPLGILSNAISEMISTTFMLVLTWKRLI